MPLSSDEQELVAAADAARANAYAPYSGYQVGAAVRDEFGRIHAGANVENVSYAVTMCAERVAIGRMVAEGRRRIVQIALVTADGGLPCGMCLQALLELAETDMPVLAISEEGQCRRFTLSDLIPEGFSSNLVKRKNDSPR